MQGSSDGARRTVSTTATAPSRRRSRSLAAILLAATRSISATSFRSRSMTMRNDAALWSFIAPRPGSSRRCGTSSERSRSSRSTIFSAVPAARASASTRTAGPTGCNCLRTARGAEAVLKRGFTALKFDPIPGPWRTYIPKDHIRRAVKVTRAVRDAIGPEVDILIEVHRRLAPMHAIDLANALAEFEPYWFEEPCQSENVEALAEVRHASRIPVVTGETLLTRAGFRPVIRARAVDIINPDVSNCGGILELMYVAAAAESEAIAVSPHNYNSTTMALSATVHASACMPNFIITEYFLPFEELGQRLCPNVLRPVDGYIALPGGPGLGFNVDEKAVRAAKGKQFPARTFRSLADEGP